MSAIHINSGKSSGEMHYAFEINKRSRTIRVNFVGKLDASAIAAYARELRASSEFDPAFSEIVDLRQVGEVELRAAHAVGLADKVDPFSLTSRRAFLVATEGQRNAVRMHQILSGGQRDIKIFNSLKDAARWLASSDARDAD